MAAISPHLFLLGTAGSGKSSLAGAFREWCQRNGLDTVLVNLDPGVESLPYTPDVDVRDWVRLTDLMTSEGLGPNGAQIAASDLIALRAEEIKEAVATFRCDYVVVDTPGQIELFVFRQSGKHLSAELAPGQSLAAYLMDPMLAREAAGFVSQLLLAASVHYRLGLPMAHVLSKADLLEETQVDRILEWSVRPDALQAALLEEEPSMYREMNADLLKTLEGLGTLPELFPVSSADFAGLDDVYSALQLAFQAAEDPTADARDQGNGARA